MLDKLNSLPRLENVSRFRGSLEKMGFKRL